MKYALNYLSKISTVLNSKMHWKKHSLEGTGELYYYRAGLEGKEVTYDKPSAPVAADPPSRLTLQGTWVSRQEEREGNTLSQLIPLFLSH